EAVRYRTRHTAGSVGKWDKDHMRAIARMGNANSIDQITAGQGGRVSLEDNRRDNIIVGTLQGFEVFFENWDEANPDTIVNVFSEMAANFTMQHGVFSGIYDSGNNTRARYGAANARAQTSGMTYHPNWSVQENVNRMKNMMNVLDPDFFNLIFDPALKDKPDDKERLKEI